MKKRSTAVICAAIMAVMLAGCAPAQAIIIDLNGPGPALTNKAAATASVEISAAPDPSATSDRSAYVDAKEAQKDHKPTATFISIDEKDFTKVERGTPVIFTRDFSIVLPSGSIYYYLKDKDTPAFMARYKDTSIIIKKSDMWPEDMLGLNPSSFNDMQNGTAAYNGIEFAYIGYAAGKSYLYDYYFEANTMCFCISFSAPTGVDMSNEIKNILDSVRLLSPASGMTQLTPRPA